jgi:hypothetical protein
MSIRRALIPLAGTLAVLAGLLSTSTAHATQYVPGPYWQTVRWTYPSLCVANHLQTPEGPGTTFQDIANGWSAAADLVLSYGVGSGACSGWSNASRIDVETGFDASKGCFYYYALYDTNNKVKRMIVYFNYNYPGCWMTNTTTTNWHKSRGLGGALGNQPFAFTDFAGGYWVMATRDSACCSYAQANDLHTFDYYNNL